MGSIKNGRLKMNRRLSMLHYLHKPNLSLLIPAQCKTQIANKTWQLRHGRGRSGASCHVAESHTRGQKHRCFSFSHGHTRKRLCSRAFWHVCVKTIMLPTPPRFPPGISPDEEKLRKQQQARRRPFASSLSLCDVDSLSDQADRLRTKTNLRPSASDDYPCVKVVARGPSTRSARCPGEASQTRTRGGRERVVKETQY